MYSNQTLYYLQQLGITPWVRRKTLVSKPRLSIFIPNILPLMAEHLLQNLIDFLNLDNGNYTITKIEETNRLNPEPTEIALFFGTSLVSQIDDHFEKKIISQDLNAIIKDPKQKKQLFQQLSLIKEYFTETH